LNSIKAYKGKIMQTMEVSSNFFTVRELASYLKMKPITIYKHASGGKIPGFKVGSHWRFRRETIERWIKDKEKANCQ